MLTSYQFQFNSGTGVITGSDGYTFDGKSRISSILGDSTYKANDLVYSMTEDWLWKHAAHCRQATGGWNWDCIKLVVAPNVLSDAYMPLYPAIDAWIAAQRGSVVTFPGGSTGGSAGGSTGGSSGGSSTGESGFGISSTMWWIIGGVVVLAVLNR